jgi:hypothetical protein
MYVISALHASIAHQRLYSICVLLVGCFIPLWILPSTFSGLAAGAFCIQFGVQGAWGVVSSSALFVTTAFNLRMLRNLDPNPACRDISPRIPCDLPRCGVPAWKRMFFHAYVVFLIAGSIDLLTSCFFFVYRWFPRHLPRSKPVSLSHEKRPTVTDHSLFVLKPEETTSRPPFPGRRGSYPTTPPCKASSSASLLRLCFSSPSLVPSASSIPFLLA